jgi:hypothetical protein
MGTVDELPRALADAFTPHERHATLVAQRAGEPPPASRRWRTKGKSWRTTQRPPR